MSDAGIGPEKKGGAWVRLPDGNWVRQYSQEHMDFGELLGQKKEGSSDSSPEAPSPEVGSAAEVSERKFNMLTSPRREQKQEKEILRLLEKLEELLEEG